MDTNKDGEHSVRLLPLVGSEECPVLVATYDINDKLVTAYYPMTVEQAAFAATCILNGHAIPKPNEIDQLMNGYLIQKLSQAML